MIESMDRVCNASNSENQDRSQSNPIRILSIYYRNLFTFTFFLFHSFGCHMQRHAFHFAFFPFFINNISCLSCPYVCVSARVWQYVRLSFLSGAHNLAEFHVCTGSRETMRTRAREINSCIIPNKCMLHVYDVCAMDNSRVAARSTHSHFSAWASRIVKRTCHSLSLSFPLSLVVSFVYSFIFHLFFRRLLSRCAFLIICFGLCHEQSREDGKKWNKLKQQQKRNNL